MAPATDLGADGGVDPFPNHFIKGKFEAEGGKGKCPRSDCLLKAELELAPVNMHSGDHAATGRNTE